MVNTTTRREGIRNSQIRNWQLVKHTAGHNDMPFELLWAFRRPGASHVEVTWRFFKTRKLALSFASDLENAVVTADGRAK